MLDNNIATIIKSDLSKQDKLSAILKYLFIDIAKINQKKYCIIGSYSIRNYRTISDLDVNLNHDEFFKLKILTDNSLGKIEIYNNQIRWYFNMTDDYNKLTNNQENDFSIEAFQCTSDFGYPNKEFSLSYLLENNGLDTDKNNHLFFNINTLLKWKKTMNRSKDQLDIELIEKLLNNKTKRNRKVSKRKQSKRKQSKRKQSKRKQSK
jgi:hypothetical protein